MSLFIMPLLGCGDATSKNTKKTSDTPQFRVEASLQELMLAVIDPNIDPIWNSISTVSSSQGIVEVKPQTDEDWQKLKYHGIVLREVSNLLILDGRVVAHDVSATSSHHSELHADKIQVLIKNQWPDFVNRAHQFHDAVNQVLVAIEHKNVDDLERAGGIIEQACEACHSQFWYPGDKRPTE